MVAGMLALGIVGNAAAQDAAAVISATSKAMGADALTSIQYSGVGNEFAFGQGVNPTAPLPGYEYTSYVRIIDFEMPAWRLDRAVVQADPARLGGGPYPPPSQTVIVNPNTPWNRQLELWMTPFGFLRAAKTYNATASATSIGGKTFAVLTFTAPNKAKMIGYVNDKHLVERVETTIATMFGDTALEASFTRYKNFDGVKFPTRIVQKEEGKTILDLTVTDVKPNAHAMILQQQELDRPRLLFQPPQKLADGVYMSRGLHVATMVEFQDYIVVIEAPSSEARAIEILDSAKKLFPTKPIKYVVNTHSHSDHSDGLRTFAAEGITIITHEINKAYLERVLNAPHTLNPDRLAASPKKVMIETMADKRVLTDGHQTLELHLVRGSQHSEGLVMGYLPKDRILIEADAFDPMMPASAPPMPLNANDVLIAKNLVDNIDRLGLDVDTIIPVHYTPDFRKFTKADLLAYVGMGK
jgi:glyoxylase-like metal-dependent hydrolase (beta-lactamase superfamily II)